MVTEGDGRVHVETTKGHCIFTIEGAERQDEGIYSVVVRNPAGEDTADINVKVVGKTELHPFILMRAVQSGQESLNLHEQLLFGMCTMNIRNVKRLRAHRNDMVLKGVVKS